MNIDSEKWGRHVDNLLFTEVQGEHKIDYIYRLHFEPSKVVIAGRRA